MKLNDVESLLGRAGVRVGTAFQVGDIGLQPFLGAAVWHEFADNNQFSAVFDPLATNNRATLSMSSNRIGTFGQYTVGLSASMPQTGWFGYARLDYRNGENIETLSVNGGIRYQFAPPPQGAIANAYAADKRMFTKATPQAVVQERWSGFYLGGYVGGAQSGNVTATELAATPVPGGVVAYNGIGAQTAFGLGQSLTGGLTLGYNRQMGSIVAGVEAEGGYLRFAGSALFPVINPAKVVVSTTQIGDWYALLAGRLGVSVGPALVYAKGGGALLNITSTDIDAATPLIGNTHNTVDAAGGNTLGLTWVAGGGVEVAVNNNWSIKGEYLYFGTRGSHVVSGPGYGKAGFPTPADHAQYFNWRHDTPGVHAAKFGINYKFGG